MTIDFRRLRYVLVALVAILIAAGAYAFTASNTVPDTNAGAGSKAIAGYTISNVAYHLGATPTDIASVTFDLDKAAGTVKIQLVTAGTWYDCSITSGTSISCDTTVGSQATVSPANNLTVVATD